jgi:hypothetical protein
VTDILALKIKRQSTYFYEYIDGLLSRCPGVPALWQFSDLEFLAFVKNSYSKRHDDTSQ